jgi:hypothetical protein
LCKDIIHLHTRADPTVGIAEHGKRASAPLHLPNGIDQQASGITSTSVVEHSRAADAPQSYTAELSESVTERHFHASPHHGRATHDVTVCQPAPETATRTLPSATADHGIYAIRQMYRAQRARSFAIAIHTGFKRLGERA